MENHEDCFHQTLTGKERMKIKQALQEPMNAYNICPFMPIPNGAFQQPDGSKKNGKYP